MPPVCHAQWWWLRFSELTPLSVSYRAVKSSPQKSGKDMTTLLRNLFFLPYVLWVKMTENAIENELWIWGVKMGTSILTFSYTLYILRQVPQTLWVLVTSFVSWTLCHKFIYREKVIEINGVMYVRVLKTILGAQ